MPACYKSSLLCKARYLCRYLCSLSPKFRSKTSAPLWLTSTTGIRPKRLRRNRTHTTHICVRVRIDDSGDLVVRSTLSWRLPLLVLASIVRCPFDAGHQLGEQQQSGGEYRPTVGKRRVNELHIVSCRLIFNNVRKVMSRFEYD